MKRSGKYLLRLLVTSLLVYTPLQASPIRLLHKDAVIWLKDQTIRGILDSSFALSGTLYVNGSPVLFTCPAHSDTFTVPVTLGDGVNLLVARAESGTVSASSDTVRFTLGYKLRPWVCAYPTVAGNTVRLHASVLENPKEDSLGFFWRQDTVKNPQSLTLSGQGDSLADVTIPAGAKHGEYFFDLFVYPLHGGDTAGDTARARTLVTIDSTGIIPFDLRTDHARWIDTAALYELMPHTFVANGTFADITAKISELAALGINTLWLMPINTTNEPYHGYHTLDYFGIREDLGTAADLDQLVETAHAHGLRVLLDLAATYTNIHHPYAEDAIQYGPESHYYDFYGRNPEDYLYGGSMTVGLMQFVRTFYDELVLLNYNNPELERMMIEAARYWIERFDVDGYRFDSYWEMRANNPQYCKDLRVALKSLKPDILILAEDSATASDVFDERADAAYDWRSLGHLNDPTAYLYNTSQATAPNAITLRCLENSDTPRFIATHDLESTKFAGLLMFSMPGIPMIFNGQEVGVKAHPYDGITLYDRERTIQSYDSLGLYDYYKLLIRMRKQFAALRGNNLQRLTTIARDSAGLHTSRAYRRWIGKENLILLYNGGASDRHAAVVLPLPSLHLDAAKTYYLTDILHDTVWAAGTPNEIDTVLVFLPAGTARMVVLADSVAKVVSGVKNEPVASLHHPKEFGLSQNYPNPFNPTTHFEYQVPTVSHIRVRIYNMLGQLVATLADEIEQAGFKQVLWNGSSFASGIYFYRLEATSLADPAKTFTSVKKMVLVK